MNDFSNSTLFFWTRETFNFFFFFFFFFLVTAGTLSVHKEGKNLTRILEKPSTPKRMVKKDKKPSNFFGSGCYKCVLGCLSTLYLGIEPSVSALKVDRLAEKQKEVKKTKKGKREKNFFFFLVTVIHFCEKNLTGIFQLSIIQIQ